MAKKEKKSKKEAEIKDIASNQILIRVYKNFGSNTNILKAEYKAMEQRDVYNNLISINKEFLHNEDTDFTIDDVYREMQIILEFKNMKKQDKIDKLDTKIDKQDKLVAYLKRFPELNGIYNYADESLKARDYKILRNYIKHHDDLGAYFTIEKGMRVYSFESVDGFLVPIWHGVDTYTQYPDHTRKLKITVQEDLIMRQEMKEINRDKALQNAMFIALIVCVVLTGIMVLGVWKTWDIYDNQNEKISANAFSCVEQTTALNLEIAQLIETGIIDELKADNNIAPTKDESIQQLPDIIQDLG